MQHPTQKVWVQPACKDHRAGWRKRSSIILLQIAVAEFLNEWEEEDDTTSLFRQLLWYNAAFKKRLESLEDIAETRMIHSVEKPKLQRAVTEVHSIKFTKYKVKVNLGFGYNYQYKDSLSSISALSNLAIIVWNYCTANLNTAQMVQSPD